MELVESNILHIDSSRLRVSEIGYAFLTLQRSLNISERCRVAVISAEQHCLIECLVGLYRAGRGGLLLPLERATADIRSALERDGFTILDLTLDGDTIRHRNGLNLVEHSQPQQHPYLLTSGTTGAPKILQHSWKSLATQRSDISRREHRWILTYTAGTYAWYQMLMMALFCQKQNLIVCSSNQPEDIWSVGLTARATAISSTPSFWRYLLLRCSRDELSQVRLEQISLGGEVVNQAILNELHALYPTARLSHLYASTEAGVGFVVSDGLAGFPKEWLEVRAPGRPVLAIKDGVLWIESPHAAAGCEGLFCTNDAVEIAGDRVFIQGRIDTGFLNIGGQKVSTYVVEDALAKHPEVAWCRVYAKKAPIVGALVAADVVLRSPASTSNTEDIDRELSTHCTSLGLTEAAIPRIWRYLDSIPLRGNFKS